MSARALPVTVSTPSAPALNPLAMAVATLALLACFLCVPPFIIQVKARNLAASFLIGGYTILNMFNFLNATIWAGYPTPATYNGVSLCDIEIKFFIAVPGGLAGATVSIFRQLSNMVNTNRPTGADSKGQRMMNRAFEFGTCFGVTIYLMSVHYIVQPSRYGLAPIQGCVATLDPSWVGIILIAFGPSLLHLVGAVYCGLATTRVWKHHRDVSGILSASNATKSRYRRLFALACLMLLANLPLGLLNFASIFTHSLHAYSWARVHPSSWSQRVIITTSGEWRFFDGADRYLQVIAGYVLFVFFGFTDEAKVLYRTWLKALCLSHMRNLNTTHQAVRSVENAQPSDIYNQFSDASQIPAFVPEAEAEVELAMISRKSEGQTLQKDEYQHGGEGVLRENV